MSNLNLTVSDLFTAAYSLSDIHPETCQDVDLRNVKALSMAAHDPSFNNAERDGAVDSLLRTIRRIGEREGWDRSVLQEFSFAAIRWGRENCGIEFGVFYAG